MFLSWPWLLYSQPLPTVLPTTQCPGCGKRETGLFDSILKPDTHSDALTFPWGEFTSQEGLSVPWAVLRRWGRTRVKSRFSSYPPQRDQSWKIFCSSSVLELLHWTPGLPKRCSHPWMISTSVFFGGKMAENFYSVNLRIKLSFKLVTFLTY